jgi:hypothetical protein
MRNTLFIVLLVAASGLVQAQNNRYDDRYSRSNNRTSQSSRWDNNRSDNREYDQYHTGNYGSSPRGRLGNLGINELLYLTRDRINRGIANRQLNRSETRRLVRDLQEIEEHLQDFHRNGRVSRYEEQHLKEDLLALNDRIRWESSDEDYYNRNYNNNYNNYNQNQNNRWGRRG